MPLEGVKVFDATQGVAGPHSTMLLAQHGAEVTKLEPLDGDWGRTLGKTYGDQCAHSIVFNRGKKSLAMDMKNKAAQEVAFKLASEADVVVESFRPGVMARFGIGYNQVKAANPEVIYLSVIFFGIELTFHTDINDICLKGRGTSSEHPSESFFLSRATRKSFLKKSRNEVLALASHYIS